MDGLCFLSKNLYNSVNYFCRQKFFTKELLPSAYDLINTFTKEKQPDYFALPAQTAQQVIKQVRREWDTFFKLCKSKEKLKGKPRPPKYKDKVDGRNIVVFTNQQCRLKDGYIHFPKRAALEPIKTRVDNIREVRIIPKCSHFVVEVVYDKKCEPVQGLDKVSCLSIDMGINNLATCFDVRNNRAFIVDGRGLKSMNQYFNKLKARYMSYIGDRGRSRRLDRLSLKRNNKVHDYMHKASRYVIDYCVEHGIGRIVIGKNDGWKQEVDLGRVNNQKFVSIPFNKLVWQLTYKAEEVGIEVVVTEEAYTSKIDHYALEEMCHHNTYLGKRVKRGLFKSSTGKLINADLNGALGVYRKVSIESGFSQVVGRGVVATPSRVHLV